MSEKTGRVRRWNGCTCSDGYRCNVNCPCGAPTKSGVCVCFSVSRLTSERDEAVRERDGWREIAGEQAGYIHSMSGLVAEACKARDEAVRVAGELRAALEKLGRRHCMASLQGGVSAAWKKVAAGVLDHVPEPEVAYLGDDRWECSHEVCAEVRALLASLTASTGGSSDEPQKEIRE